jgi:inward rectifier potassium channel
MLNRAKKKPARPSDHHVVINRDGSLNIHRPPDHGKFFSDFYHFFLSISWPRFFGVLVGLFLTSNVLFAILYFLAGPTALTNAHAELGRERFIDCFFFSVYTLNGPYTPTGIWPNLLVTVQMYLGMMTLVIVTGLFYARFARPSARVIFSDFATITTYNGRPAFVFRVANARLNQIIEARMNLTLSREETSKEGESSRKLYPMKLEGDYSPLFALSWTIRHFIDEDSPLYGIDAEVMRRDQYVIFASLYGLDDTFSQTISARSVYRYDEILFNKRFKDILVWKNGQMHIDLKGIHDMI